MPGELMNAHRLIVQQQSRFCRWLTCVCVCRCICAALTCCYGAPLWRVSGSWLSERLQRSVNTPWVSPGGPVTAKTTPPSVRNVSCVSIPAHQTQKVTVLYNTDQLHSNRQENNRINDANWDKFYICSKAALVKTIVSFRSVQFEFCSHPVVSVQSDR